MGARIPAVLFCLAVGSCATAPAAEPTATTVLHVPELARSAAVPTIRLVFVGDVMLGRGVAPVVDADPSSVFERLRPALVDADLALANLESPLTSRPHLVGPHALEADPSAATLLAGAGFDVVGVANNHAGDAGPATLLDTLSALDRAGLVGVGGGASADAAAEPVVVDVAGLIVGILAVDLSGGERATATTAGVNAWDVDETLAAVAELRRRVDVLVVGLHGGVEYLPRPDPGLAHVTDLLAEWGVDVVWGHGAHVAYPVEIAEHGGRRSVVAPGLGNALFDQRLPRTESGTVLEVLAGPDGIQAARTGRLDIAAGRAGFAGWDDPVGDAVALDGDWWSPVASWEPADVPAGTWGVSPLRDDADEVARSIGDVTGTGVLDLVVAYRRPARPERAHDTFDDVEWFDGQGRTAHLAVYTQASRMRWGSALLYQPVGAIAVCEGAMALGFTAIDDDAIVAGGAWIWDGFGFRTAEVLAGATTPACADIDRDGRTDPVLTDRGPSSSPGDARPADHEMNE